MASGSSGRGSNSGSKAFDFGSDDILCSYDDFGNQDANNGNHHSDPSIAANSAKEFHKSRMSRSTVYPSANYSPPEESSYHQDVVATVENTMKKHTDNIMRFLEGLSSRMSQLELYCYNLDKSIGEMRSDLIRGHGESESKLKSLDKHMQEIHRSVQILRDKQELADTQKELAKLQLAQKESSATNSPQKNEEKVPPPSADPLKTENTSDAPEQRLALALPHQVAPSPPRPAEHQQPPMPPSQSMPHQQPSMPPPQSMPHQQPPMLPPQSMPQVQGYYMSPPPPQMTNVNVPSQPQYLPPPQQQSQMPDHSRTTPVQPSQVNQSPPVQPVPAYQQQQWPQQQQQNVQVQSPQQPVVQPQIRNNPPSPQMAYSTYIPSQSPQDMAPNSMPMQGAAPSEAITYGYGSYNRPVQSQPPPAQNLKISSGYGPQQPVDGYVPSGPRQAPPPGSGYIVYDNEGGRLHQHHHPSNPQPHYQPNVYPTTSLQPQRMPSPNNMVVVPQSTRGHPYSELIEKLVGMGYRGDHAVAVIQRLEESGQPVDFNSVLDRLNGHGSGGSSQRGWSG